ncbi:MAG: right-handed parallel beta-helix repeat-containing protein [Pyrinomonadaceae bacterium]
MKTQNKRVFRMVRTLFVLVSVLFTSVTLIDAQQGKLFPHLVDSWLSNEISDATARDAIDSFGTLDLTPALYASTVTPEAPACTKVRLPGPNLRAFLDTLTPGDVGCLRAGDHGARGIEAYMTVSGTPSAPITLKGYPGDARPTILGYFPIGGNNIVISGLLFDGPTGLVDANPNTNPPIPPREVNLIWISGDNVEINHCEIRKSLAHAGIYLQDADNARIIGNYIHDNGNFNDPSTANLDHGIYFGSGSGLIANNIVEKNYAFGVHLYPSASNVIVQQNTIIKNGKSGVIIGGKTTDCQGPCPSQPTNNQVVNNIIALNGLYAIHSHELTTSGHIVRNNLFWQNAAGDIPSDERLKRGLTFQNNIQADPRFVGTSNYHLLTGSPAIDAALNLYTQPDDYDFIVRPQGAASDIGAFEYTTAGTGSEADVSPRPNGNGAVSSTDVSVIQGFQLGLGLPYQSNEFQRADCAPFNSRGDGRISSIDVSQAQAYQLGFNLALDGTLQAAAGPIAPAGGASTFEPDTMTNYGETNQANVQSDVQASREVRVVNSSAGIGQTITVPIEVDAVGDESVYGFSLSYDSTKLSNPVVTIGRAGGSVSSNTSQAGIVGISVSFGGGTIAAGNNQRLMNIRFSVAADATTGTPLLAFTDTLAFREVASSASNSGGVQALATRFTDGVLTITGKAATVSVSGRLLTAQGRGIKNVVVTMTDSNGNVRRATSESGGRYRFAAVEVGQTYLLTAKAKRYTFGKHSQVLDLNKDNTDINFIGYSSGFLRQ